MRIVLALILLIISIASSVAAAPQTTAAMPDLKDYLVATGRGELTRGSLVCERIADTMARAAVAKQIRVFVEETFTHRQHEQSGQPFEQDLEIVVKETMRELLQGVQIIAHTVDEKAMTCSSIATMLKSRITDKINTSLVTTPPSP